VSRDYDTLYRDALSQRQTIIDKHGFDEHGELRRAEFVCSPEENCLIKARCRPCYELSSARDRICGLTIVVRRQ